MLTISDIYRWNHSERDSACETNNDPKNFYRKAYIIHFSKNYGSLTLQTNFNLEFNMGDLTCLFRDSSYP